VRSYDVATVRRVRSVHVAVAFGALCAAAVTGSAVAAESAVVPRDVYVRRADAVCLDVAKKALALQREAQRLVNAADSDANARRILGRVYRSQLGLVRGMRLRIVAIGTPRGATAARVASRLVAGIRTGERALEDVIAAIESGSLTTFQRAVLRYKAVSLESARAVRRSGLGFRYCGAGA
jgi:hypothetical protein